jgi:hypothetical protein
MEAATRYSVECVELLLAKGADTTVENSFGRTVFDYMKSHPPILNLLEPHPTPRHPLSFVEQDRKLRETLRRYLAQLPNVFPLSSGIERSRLDSNMWSLAHCFFFLKYYASARICLEARTIRPWWFESEIAYYCDLCEKEDGLKSLWACKDCSDLAGMCPSCYEGRTEEKIMPGCNIKHEYFEIGGLEWAKLGPGLVDKDGKTIDQFISELKEKYCNEDVESPELTDNIPGISISMILSLTD